MKKLKRIKFKLICYLIYIIFTIPTLQGQSCNDNNEVIGIITGTETSNAIYSSYSSTANSTWASNNWTGEVDFSGIAFDANRTCTLISPRHVLMATHYQRSVGSTIVFHNSNGDVHTAKLTAKQSVPDGLNPDITVGLLDVDVPVKYYKILNPSNEWITCLDNVLVVSTHHTRQASIREVSNISGLRIGFTSSNAVPTSYYASVVSGNSGNPNFLIIDGEPILISTFTYGGGGSGPFFSNPSNFNSINSIMASLGGGYQLETATCTCDTLSIEDVENASNNILVYPNPTSDILNLKYSQIISDIEVLDINGRLILKSPINAKETTVNLNYLQNGIYILKINSEYGTITKKIIIE